MQWLFGCAGAGSALARAGTGERFNSNEVLKSSRQVLVNRNQRQLQVNKIAGKHMNNFAAFFVGCAVAYLAGAFFEAFFDIAHWGALDRAVVALAMMGCGLIALSLRHLHPGNPS